jgi:hypothetical protein
MEAKTKKTLKIVAWSLSGVAALFVAGYVGTGIYILSIIADSAVHTPESKPLLQRISDPARNADYLLMTNGRLQDRAWYIYSVPTGSPPTDEMLAQDHSAPSLIFSYAESANHCTDEKLEIVMNRYLVFSRGGVRHSLYDLDTDETLFNITGPWWEYPHEEGNRPSVEDFHEWALVAMDQKIKSILDERSRQ